MALKTCTCGALILWAKTAKGRPIPLNATPDPKGNIELRDGVARFVKADPNADLSLLDPPTRYTTHFVNCPHAAEHRKK